MPPTRTSESTIPLERVAARKGITLADRVRHLRRKKGLTQLELARRAEVRPETVSRLERGKGGGLTSLSAIARELGTTVDALLGTKSPRHENGGHNGAKPINGNGHRAKR